MATLRKLLSLGAFALLLLPMMAELTPTPQAGPLQTLASPTATIDFMPAPTLPSNPSSADQGAYEYWLHCLACHGDAGQGLTDEFRARYPPSHQDCWKSGCHGPRPYDGGWTLPSVVPAVIGPSLRQRFGDAATLEAFVQVAMPWHAPGSLKPETVQVIVDYLARENGLPAAATPEPLPTQQHVPRTEAQAQRPEIALEPSDIHTAQTAPEPRLLRAFVGGLLMLLLGSMVLWMTRRRSG